MTSTASIRDRIDKCRKILDADPNSQIFAALAEAYRRSGDLDKAFRVCQAGLKIHPSYGAAHIVMAKINLDRHQYDWAEIETRKAAELDGWTRAAELLLAETHIYKGEFQQAMKILQRLKAGDPQNEQVMRLLEIAEQLPRQQSELLPEEDQNGPADSDEPTLVDKQPTDDATPLEPDQILAGAIELPGIDGALFFNFEGLVIAEQWALPEDSGAHAAALADVFKKVHGETEPSPFGATDTVLVETEGYSYYLIRHPRGILLFVIGTSANLGSLRVRLQALLENAS